MTSAASESIYTANDLQAKIPKCNLRSSIWESLDNITDTSSSQPLYSTQTPNITGWTKPVSGWAINPATEWSTALAAAKRSQFSHPLEMAQAYISASPTSVASEQLFSTTGSIVTDRHSRMLPENMEHSILKKYNSRLL